MTAYTDAKCRHSEGIADILRYSGTRPWFAFGPYPAGLLSHLQSAVRLAAELGGGRYLVELCEGSWIVADQADIWWTICDNVGELNISPINERPNPRSDRESVPYTGHGWLVGPGTLARRILDYMLGQGIVLTETWSIAGTVQLGETP